MRAVAVILFLAGLLLAVRVMFFGVRRVAEERLYHRAWPLALAAWLMVVGAMTYSRADNAGPRVTAGWLATVLILGGLAGAGARWVVRRSAAAPSTDPDDDPRYRFQGHVARVVEYIESDAGTAKVAGRRGGRIVFVFDGKQHELRAAWSPDGDRQRQTTAAGAVDSEVVIERVEGDVAYVEPWTAVEERL